MIGNIGKTTSVLSRGPKGSSSALLKRTKTFRDRVESSGGLIEDGALEGLYDPVLKTIKGFSGVGLSDLVFFGAASAVEVNSGSIPTIFDASGEENDAAQSTTSKQFTRKTDAIGGRVGAEVDESDDLMDSPASATQPTTHIFVAKTPNGADGSQDYVFDGTSNRQLFYGSNTDQQTFQAGNPLEFTFSDTNVRAGAVLFDGSNSEAELGNRTASADTGTNNISTLRLGARTTGNENLAGLFLMHALIDAPTTRSQRNTLRSKAQEYYSL